MTHKAGFVNIIGNPNVGKSTLMNAMVGEKLSIITSKAQTTRHRILGILNNDDFQIIFSDTPGLLQPKYLLQESMLKSAKSALKDADILVFVTDIFEDYEEHTEILNKINKVKIPVLLLINKVDLGNKEKYQELEDKWKQLLPNAELYFISALKGKNIIEVFKRILDLLPEHPAYYPKDTLTDKPERFFVSETIREKILQQYKKEIPYACEINVEEFKEEKNIIRIKAMIYVERDSQKGILIGHKGSAIKKVGTAARLDIEAFFDKKVFLELSVKINKDWRNKAAALKRFGY